MTIYNLRAFSVSSLQFIYFTFSKTYFSILSINFYKTPHISLFILKYILFKQYKKIPFFFSLYTPNTSNPPYPTSTKLYHQPQKHDLVTAPGQISHHRRRPPSRGLGYKIEENMKERKEKEFLDREQRIKKSKQKFYKSYSTR